MGRIEKLAERYKRFLALPRRNDLAGAERVLFVVYDKSDERRLRARKELFALATRQAGYDWIDCDLTDVFARWMADIDYRESYFESPEDLALKLDRDFPQHVAGRIRAALAAPQAGGDSVVAVSGIALPVRLRAHLGTDARDRNGYPRLRRRVLPRRIRK